MAWTKVRTAHPRESDLIHAEAEMNMAVRLTRNRAGFQTDTCSVRVTKIVTAANRTAITVNVIMTKLSILVATCSNCRPVDSLFRLTSSYVFAIPLISVWGS